MVVLFNTWVDIDQIAVSCYTVFAGAVFVFFFLSQETMIYAKNQISEAGGKG